MFNKAFKDTEDGLKITGVDISTISYAHDTIIVADKDLGLQRLIEKLNLNVIELRMKTNDSKTKIMKISSLQNISLPITSNGVIIEQINKMKYLGCWKNRKLNPNQESKFGIE